MRLEKQIVRKLFLLALGLLSLVAGLLVWIVAPSLASPEPAKFRVSPQRLAMLGLLPANSTDLVVLPSFASTVPRLQSNPITKRTFDEITRDRPVGLLSYLLGNCDVILSRNPSLNSTQWSYVANPAGLRRTLIEAYLRQWPQPDVWVEGSFVRSGPRSATSGAIRDPATFADLSALDPGHFFYWRQSAENIAFPPLRTPAFAAVTISDDEVRVQARSLPLSASTPSTPLPQLQHPDNAVLSAILSRPPEILEHLERTLPIDITSLLDGGGAIALYDIDSSRRLPRPYFALALESNSPRAAEVTKLLSGLESRLPIPQLSALIDNSTRTVGGAQIERREGLGLTIEKAVREKELMVAFDKSSVEHYLTASVREKPRPGAQWSLRLIPGKLLPVLQRLRAHEGARFLPPDVARTALDVERFLERVGHVSSILVEQEVAERTHATTILLRSSK